MHAWPIVPSTISHRRVLNIRIIYSSRRVKEVILYMVIAKLIVRYIIQARKALWSHCINDPCMVITKESLATWYNFIGE